MDSKFVNTKNLEKDGKTAATKKLSKEELLKAKKDKFRENYAELMKENKDAPELGPQTKKKPANDIIKKNAAAAAAAANAKKPGTATVGGRKETIDIKISGAGGLNYTIGNEGPGMFSKKADIQAGNVPPLEFKKKPTARDLILDECKLYHAKPNPKKLKELKDKCANLNINFD
jgi:hypothetical protein